MGRKFRSGHGPDEAMLMPADPREWLPAGHLAWRVLDLAGEMDLAGFGAGYRADGQGGRPFDPRMMATLLLYCYCRGRRSSREIEAATFDDVGARVICGGLHPDHSTVAGFVRRNAAAVAALLPESVKACAAEGLVDLALVAGDGTKLKANAAMAANLTREQLSAQVAELEAWIGQEVREWVQDVLGEKGPAPADGDGGPRGGDGGGKPKWKSRPPRAAQMLERRLAARDALDAAASRKDRADCEARAAKLAARLARSEEACARREEKVRARLEARAAREAAGEKVGGRRPLSCPEEDRDLRELRAFRDKTRAAWEAASRPAATTAGPDARVNATDPSSGVMPLKKGGYDQLHNAQALAVAGSQVILAVTRHPSPADVSAMLPLLAEARRVARQAGVPGQIGSALFDAGYASDANFTAGVPETLYVAVTREARQAGRSADGRDPATALLPSWQAMADRLAAPGGKALYRKRAGIIEPVFAQLTARLGRTLHYRGDLADTELALWAASHNLLKAATARTRRLSRQVPALAPA
jgi:transposase